MARRQLLGVVATVTLMAGGWVAWSEIAESRAYGFEKIAVPGVPNVGRINAHLYRGGQPTDAGLAALRSLGVDTVVSFTLEGEGARREAAAARALGLQYIHMPWSANQLPPRDYVTQFLQLVSSQPSRVVFAHCKAGSDRTGVMIALYRITSDGWTVDRAMSEMAAFGYEVEFHPQLRAFVRSAGSP